MCPPQRKYRSSVFTRQYYHSLGVSIPVRTHVQSKESAGRQGTYTYLIRSLRILRV